MKFKTSASLMIAVVLGLVTAYVGLDVLKKNKGGSGPGLKVVVAARDMEPGYVIEESDLKLEPVSASFAPAKSIKETKLVVGRTVMATVVKGYPILDNQLSAPGAGSGMQAMIPKGMRAFAVEASEGSAAAGLITPGSFVDVIATLRKGDEPISMAVVQKAKVQFVQRSRATRSNSSAALSAGSPDALGPIKTVTLLVTPKQANALELAQNSGKLKLVLRGNADDGDAEDSSITQREMLGLPPEDPKPETVVVERPPVDAFEEPAPPVDDRRPVQMIKGGSESTIYFDKEGNQTSEEGNGSAPDAATAQKSSQKKRPATRPQPEPQSEDGNDPRTASGASPDPQAPRTEAGRGTLRRGM